MKKLIILLIAIIIIGLFSGCGTESNEIVSTWKRCGEIKRSGDNLDIYYDINTKVMYADGPYGHTTVLLNADGTPMLYECEDK